MPYLVDTCVVSEHRKQSRCNPGVTAWIESIQPDELYLSVLTVGEIRRGIELLRQKDPKTANVYEAWLIGLETYYGERILPITSAIADKWGRLSPTQPLPTEDGLIAATGLEHNLTVVTRNVADFKRSGVNTINPFT